MKQLIFAILNFLSINLVFAVKTPEIKNIVSNEIVKYENSILYIESKIEIYNPNLIPLNFEKISMSFNEKGKKYAEGQNLGEAFLPAKKSNEVSFEIKIHLDSMSSDFINDFISKDSIKLNCTVSGILGLFKIKISEKLVVNLDSKQLLDPLKTEFINNTHFLLKEIKLLEVDLNRIKLQIPVSIKNPFPFELKVTAIDIKMYSNADFTTKVGEVMDKSEVLLQAEKELTVAKELSINTLQGGLTGLLKAVQREFDYYILGNITAIFGKYELVIPIKEKIVVDPVKGTVK